MTNGAPGTKSVREVIGAAGVGTPEPPSTPPENLLYRLKVAALGPPLTTARLHSERLSRPIALGVLAPDCISSSAYGTEEMLIALLPAFGLLSFVLVLPITGLILFILVLLTFSYRQVVQVYTRAGGSYVVARDNFGPRIAQVAAVALLIDYVVTVAVQAAAGTVAVVSAIPALGPYSMEITIGVVAVLAYGNLRGVREAGRFFALPTYFFVIAVGAVIIGGLIRAALGNLPRYNAHELAGSVPVGTNAAGLTTLAIVLTLARSFANGGSSLTGLEAISNSVSAFRPPEGRNASKSMLTMSLMLGFLVAGVSWLAHATHATPFTSGYPSVIAQEARLVVGTGRVSDILYYLVQATSALILYTGANTSFNGFPYLASFVAGDSFLPHPLRQRGHRLAFSNGIILLAAISMVLLLVTRARVNSLVPFYAIGVFTGFTMAGFGMARYHHTHPTRGWKRRMIINGTAGGMSAVVVLIFAVVKFTEGAWAVVVLFPILVALLIRLNKRYRAEAGALATYGHIIDSAANPARHAVVVLVDDMDLAVLQALRYARVLRPNTLTAVHFATDNVRAERLVQRWQEVQRGDIPLQLRDCPDRRLGRAAVELAAALVDSGRTEVTMVLPRRVYGKSRWLHAYTADRIAAAISRVPHAAATIIPFDVNASIRRLQAIRPPTGRRARAPVPPPSAPAAEPAGVGPQPSEPAEPTGGPAAPVEPTGAQPPAAAPAAPGAPGAPARPPAPAAARAWRIPPPEPAAAGEETLGPPPAALGATPVTGLRPREREVTEGVIRSVQVSPVRNSQVLEAELVDPTGALLLRFYGRGYIRGITPGRRIRVEGMVGRHDHEAAIANPRYELLEGDD